MARKKYWIGSRGPFYYDDATRGVALETDGQLKIDTAPTDAGHVVRKSDLSSYAPVGAQYVVLDNNSDLTAERKLVKADPITLTDAGANSTVTIGINQAGLDHGSIGGLTDDDHSQYPLSAGRSGGQTIIGGTDSEDDLTLNSTSNATKGDVLIQTVGGNVAIGHDTPQVNLHVVDAFTTCNVAVEGNGEMGDSSAVILLDSYNDIAWLIAHNNGYFQFRYYDGSDWFTFFNLDYAGHLYLSSDTPLLRLSNTDASDANGARVGQIEFLGIQSGSEESILGMIEVSHDGTADDQKGMLKLYLNDGNDSCAPTLRLTVKADGSIILGTIKSGATQVAAGAVANELWKTSGHATLPDNVVMIGV